MSILSRALMQATQDHSINLRQLALKLEVPYANVYNWAHDTTNPSHETAVAILQKLDALSLEPKRPVGRPKEASKSQ